MSEMLKVCALDLEICVTHLIHINQNKVVRSIAPVAAQKQLCRQAIKLFAHYGILASPERDRDSFVIVAHALSLKADFLDWLCKENLEIQNMYRADTQTIEKCLHYTVAVWFTSHCFYSVGKALVKGPLFLETDMETAK
ncbi:unnamed protein product, partial [Cylicostephanus goldi]